MKMLTHHRISDPVPEPPPTIAALLSSLHIHASSSTASTISAIKPTGKSFSKSAISNVVFGPLSCKCFESRVEKDVCVYGGVCSTFKPEVKARCRIGGSVYVDRRGIT